MRASCEIDLRDIEGACRESDSALRFGAVQAVSKGAKEGLKDAQKRRRYRDYTWRLTNTAVARLLVASGKEPDAEIFWPMRYAQKVDERRGFAGDAYVKAEQVAMREIEFAVAVVQQIFNQ